jgi:TBC1 domain family protein 5
MEELDRRNKSLAKMLEVAVGDLWEYHRERDEVQKAKEGDQKGKEAMAALSLAIAKVQFVQVYLEDSSIPLPVDEATEQASTAQAAITLASPTPQSPVSSGQASTVPPISLSTTPQSTTPLTTVSKNSSPLDSRPTSPPTRALSPPSKLASTLSPPSRPHLTSSNFSWMLGEDSASSNFASGAAHSTFSSDEKRRMKGKGFLFGDDEDDEGSIKDGKKGNNGNKGGAKGGKNAKGKHVTESEVEEEVIDLAHMGKRGVI